MYDCGLAQIVRHWLLISDAWVQSQVTSFEICGGCSGVRLGTSWSSFSFPMLMSLPLLHSCLSPSCEIPSTLTRQRIIISSVPNFWAQFLTQHLAGCRVKELCTHKNADIYNGHVYELCWLGDISY